MPQLATLGPKGAWLQGWVIEGPGDPGWMWYWIILGGFFFHEEKPVEFLPWFFNIIFWDHFFIWGRRTFNKGWVSFDYGILLSWFRTESPHNWIAVHPHMYPKPPRALFLVAQAPAVGIHILVNGLMERFWTLEWLDMRAQIEHIHGPWL